MKNTNINEPVFDNLPPLNKAIRDGNDEALQNIILADKNALSNVDCFGLTPVIHGIIVKNIKHVKLLLENGAGANDRDNQGNSALMYAISRESFAGVKLLLEHGATIAAQDSNKRNAVHLSICSKNLSILKIILECASFTDVNQADIEGMTPVHWAAFHNWSEQLRLLLDANGDPTVQDKEGKTALHWAAQNDSVACTQLLLPRCQDKDFVNMRDLEGRSPIHLAAAAGHFDVIFELSQSPGCDTESRDREGRTPLHWASAMNKERSVAGLLRLGVKNTTKDNHGVTPLMYAKEANHNLCANLLLNYDPRNPQKTLIPVGKSNEQKNDLQSSERKKMKFSDNIDINSKSIVNDLTFFKGISKESDKKDRNENLDGLNRAFGDIMTCNSDRGDVESDKYDSAMKTNVEGSSISTLDSIATNALVVSDDQVINGYSSEEDSRYLPQMAVSPPNNASPDLSESEDESYLKVHTNNAAAVGVKLHRVVSKRNSSPASLTPTLSHGYQLGPLRKKEVPEYLRVRSCNSETVEMQLPVSQTIELAPLKLRREKQNQSPSTLSIISSGSRLSRESNGQQHLMEERPLGLRKKSLSLSQDMCFAGASKEIKVLSRSKSYGYSLNKTETSVLPSIKPKGGTVETNDGFLKFSDTSENTESTLKDLVSNKKKKRTKVSHKPKK